MTARQVRRALSKKVAPDLAKEITMTNVVAVMCTVCRKPTGDEMEPGEYAGFFEYVSHSQSYPVCLSCESVGADTCITTQISGWAEQQPPTTNRGVSDALLAGLL